MIKIKCLKPNADAIFEMDYRRKYVFSHSLSRKTNTDYRGAVIIADFQGNVRFIATLALTRRTGFYDVSYEWVFHNIQKLSLDSKITKRSNRLFDIVLCNADKV